MKQQNTTRNQLMNLINQVSFAADEARLFLDTHPCDQEALLYQREMTRKRKNALQEYASSYGPLTQDTADESSPGYWNWINEPWPWQEGGC